jgi:hypothetical protein
MISVNISIKGKNTIPLPGSSLSHPKKLVTWKKNLFDFSLFGSPKNFYHSFSLAVDIFEAT